MFLLMRLNTINEKVKIKVQESAKRKRLNLTPLLKTGYLKININNNKYFKKSQINIYTN